MGSKDDEEMLEAYAVFGILTTAQVEELTAHLEAGEVLRTVVRSFQARLGLTPPGLERLYKFLNWYAQAGRGVIAAYGGVAAWKSTLDERNSSQ